MICLRREPWGWLFADNALDVLYAEAESGFASPRIDHLLSVILRPVRLTRATSRMGDGRKAGAAPWARTLEALKSAGVLRVNLAGFGVTSPHLKHLVADLQALDFSVVLTAMEGTADLEKYLELGPDVGLQIVFDPGRAFRAERREASAYRKRLRAMSRCTEAGRRIRVLTPYDPLSPVSIQEIGEDLARVGVDAWFVYPRSLRVAQEGRASVEAAIAALREDIPHLDIDYGDYLVRELDLRVDLEGRVRARGAGPLGRPLFGGLDLLAKSGRLPEAYFDRHTRSWLSGFTLYDPAPPDPVIEHLVFLAHNRLDRDEVGEVRDRLNGKRVKTWMSNSIEKGSEWGIEIEQALERSSFYLMFFGPHGIGDFQRRREFAIADNLVRQEGRTLIPVILSSVKPGVKLPPFLDIFQAVDLREGFEEGLNELAQRILLSSRPVAPGAALGQSSSL